MNIDDIKNVEIPEGSLIAAIFAHQAELMIKYDEIEKKNGAMVPDPPYNINDKVVQARIKDLFWRSTEEIAESLEHVLRGEVSFHDWRERWGDVYLIRHFFEELADALHFLVEATIISNLPASRVEKVGWRRIDSKEIGGFQSMAPSIPMVKDKCGHVVWAMGLSANCLKNKPWKSSQMMTDEVRFHEQLDDTWRQFKVLWDYLGVTLEEIYVLYAKKNQVNKFRQESNY